MPEHQVNSMDFTVAIPTYNGGKRVPEVLERLREQIGAEKISWEVIVVDNNSTDNTAQVVGEYQANWPLSSPLRYVLETEQGAACARQRAVEEARGSLVGFLDDDNIPALDWVAQAYKFGQAHPNVGVYGSQIHGDFEVEPPEDFKKIACYLAITERGSKPHRYEPRSKMLPPGAGLVVRRHVWCENVPKRLVLNHKGREAGLASEDLEVALYIQRAGWEIWYNPDMHVHHKIPQSRLSKESLVGVFRCVGLSRHHIRMLSIKSWQRPLVFVAYMVNDLRKLIVHILKHRGAIQTDLIAACERELLWCSLISPFYLWKLRYLNVKRT